MLQCAHLLYLSLKCFGRLSLTVNHCSSTSALASRAQSCPRHSFLGCHDHHCLLHTRLWASAWALGPIQKVDVYHWALWPIITPQNLDFQLLGRKKGFWYPQPTLFIVTPRLSELPNAFLPSQGMLLTLRCPERVLVKFWGYFCPPRSTAWCKSNGGGFPGFTSENFPACNFCATINSFSNQIPFLLLTITQS